MDSSAMNNFGGILGQGKEEARKGQFQYTEYTEAAYNASGFGTAGKTSAKVTHDNDMLKLYQEWKEMNIATVQVNTWIKKKSDTIKDLKKDYFLVPTLRVPLYWLKSIIWYVPCNECTLPFTTGVQTVIIVVAFLPFSVTASNKAVPEDNPVTAPVGEMTIEVNGNNVKIKSKIQMDSSAMNNFGGILGQGKEEAKEILQNSLIFLIM